MIKAMLNVENNQNITQRRIRIASNKKKLRAKILISLLQRRQMTSLNKIKHFPQINNKELCQMSLNNIEDLKINMVVNIPDSKTRVLGLYCYYLRLILTYIHYVQLMSTTNVYLLNTLVTNALFNLLELIFLGKMPTDIARFLKLPNSELYTGHCFRRTSASLFALVKFMYNKKDMEDEKVRKLQKDTWKIR
ncbi:hypothetical protein NQ317_006345 [Molorchus minor]|uniref:Uncharacterized protein n=1 Tax=Molorchus minor TaxID=1323400 RepID=A0ABQ9JMB7_9CUCU|nr:hypothetical protein NQ317_006345 [Molorchus minor]